MDEHPRGIHPHGRLVGDPVTVERCRLDPDVHHPGRPPSLQPERGGASSPVERGRTIVGGPPARGIAGAGRGVVVPGPRPRCAATDAAARSPDLDGPRRVHGGRGGRRAGIFSGSGRVVRGGLRRPCCRSRGGTSGDRGGVPHLPGVVPPGPDRHWLGTRQRGRSTCVGGLCRGGDGRLRSPRLPRDASARGGLRPFLTRGSPAVPDAGPGRS